VFVWQIEFKLSITLGERGFLMFPLVIKFVIEDLKALKYFIINDIPINYLK